MKVLIAALCSVLFLSIPIYGMGEQVTSIPVYLFSKEDCQSCGDSLQAYLSTLKSMYPFIEVKAYHAGEPSANEALTGLEKQLGRKMDEFPAVVIRDHMLTGEKEITEKLEALILEYQLKEGIPLFPLESPSSASPSKP